MQRYFVPLSNWKDNTIKIDGDDLHHVVRVMRYQVGDHMIANHPDGKAALCSITSIDTESVIASILEWLDEQVELPIDVTIAQGIPKGDKMDFVLQKGTELGARGFIPFQSSRSIVKWDKKKANKKITRYKKIIKEASEQSHRTKQPVMMDSMNLTSLLNESKHYDVKLFPYENETRVSQFNAFGQVVEKLIPGQKVLVCIGPEGGFSDQEVKQLKANDFISVRLGPRILRTETAALYVLASISYHFEELRC